MIAKAECGQPCNDFLEDNSDQERNPSNGPAHSSDEETKLLKLLGVEWNNTTDTISFNFIELLELAQKFPLTKRSLLKFSASLFDPLGLLSPFIITLKMQFQRLCTDKVNWDDPLPDDMLSEWNSMLHDLKLFSSLKVPQCFFLNDVPKSINLHGFCDESERAYAAVLYVS